MAYQNKEKSYFIPILVAPYWNLNTIVNAVILITETILVAPYWNLNMLLAPTQLYRYLILVAPYWNLNGIKFINAQTIKLPY